MNPSEPQPATSQPATSQPSSPQPAEPTPNAPPPPTPPAKTPSAAASQASLAGQSRPGFFAGLLSRWRRTPLYLRIVGALALGLALGLTWRSAPAEALDEAIRSATGGDWRHEDPLAIFAEPSRLVLRLLGALAPPLILLSVIQVLMNADLQGRMGLRLVRLLISNTLVAIAIGLFVANLTRPGEWSKIEIPPSASETKKSANPLALFLDNVPRSLLGPLGDEGKVIGVIFVAVALGIALRKSRNTPVTTVGEAVHVALQSLVTILHWLIEVIPLAVFGMVASIVATQGFGQFRALGMFVLAVLLGLALQACYYLIRVRWGSWVAPRQLLRGSRDALTMAFSTASSTATMPLTYSCLKDRVGVSERSASMGALVGANFNNDGTALYEAMSALFISQIIGAHLSWPRQLMVVLTSVVASVGAAGIPEAGLVTMTLVFSAVGLPSEYIPLLLTVDWFLDRCRTAINVMGDLTISCLLDGKTRPVAG